MNRLRCHYSLLNCLSVFTNLTQKLCSQFTELHLDCRVPVPELSIEEVKEAKEILAIQLALAETKLQTREIDNIGKQAKVEELAAIVTNQVRRWATVKGGGEGKLHSGTRHCLSIHLKCNKKASPHSQREILEQSGRDVEAQRKRSTALNQSIQDGEDRLLQAAQTIAQLQVSGHARPLHHGHPSCFEVCMAMGK
jgi:hypothetical protein